MFIYIYIDLQDGNNRIWVKALVGSIQKLKNWYLLFQLLSIAL